MPSTTSSGTVKWFLDYCYIPPSLGPVTQQSISISQEVLANQQYYHFIKGVNIPKPSSNYQIGGVILFNLRRTPTNTEDTYANDAILVKTALHVPVNDSGSREMYIK